MYSLRNSGNGRAERMGPRVWQGSPSDRGPSAERARAFDRGSPSLGPRLGRAMGWEGSSWEERRNKEKLGGPANAGPVSVCGQDARRSGIVSTRPTRPSRIPSISSE